MIAVCATRRPERRLLFQRSNNAGVIGDVDFFIQRSESGLMREQLGKGDLIFPILREFRPEFCDPPPNRDFVFLEDVKQTCASEPLCCRPDQTHRVARPGLFFSRIAKSAMKLENW